MPVSCDAWLGHPEGILARRKELQIRTLVARRERYRAMAEQGKNAGAETAEVLLSSTRDIHHYRGGHPSEAVRVTNTAS
jgi:hypothetical protein